MKIAHKTSRPIGGEISERGHTIFILDSSLRWNDILDGWEPIFGGILISGITKRKASRSFKR